MLLTCAVAVLPETCIASTVTSKESTWVSWSLIAFSQLPPLAPSLVTSALARSFLQIFSSSPAVTSVCRFLIVSAAALASPFRPDVETLLAQAESPRASDTTHGSASASLGESYRGSAQRSIDSGIRSQRVRDGRGRRSLLGTACPLRPSAPSPARRRGGTPAARRCDQQSRRGADLAHRPARRS